jgi:hypothetical protein
MNPSRTLPGPALLMCILFAACGDSSPTGIVNRDTTRPVVASVTPLANATSVAIGATITVTFSEPVDPTTVTTATLLIAGPNGPVAGSVVVAGTVATFTPAAPLTEFASSYTARVTTGVRDLAGNGLASDHSWQFATEMVSPLYWYRLSNMLFGDDRSLGTLNGPEDQCFMATTGSAIGQRWVFTATAPGVYRLSNMFRGPTMSLEGGDGSGACSLDPTGNFSGQNWVLAPSQSDPSWYRLQTKFLGAGRSLDVRDEPAVPYMAPTGNFSGQLWKVRRGERI